MNCFLLSSYKLKKMPSRVTFISVPNGNVDVERSFEEVNVTSSMVELNKDERVKKVCVACK